jgi:hypothetical protein
MTEDEIKSMHAGYEIDILVAKEVMGWRLIPEEDLPSTEVDGEVEHWAQMWLDKDNKFMHNDFFPSTDMNDAWEVVLYFESKGWCPNLVNDDAGHWALSFVGVNDLSPCTYQNVWIDFPEQWCDTAPLAICRSALLSLPTLRRENEQ